MGKPIKLKITKPGGCSGSLDGVSVTVFEEGSESLFSSSAAIDLAQAFLRYGWAEPVAEPAAKPVAEKPKEDEKPPAAKQMPVPENKQAPAVRRKKRKGR